MTPDLDYKDLFLDTVRMMAEIARAAGFDPKDENVEPPDIAARVENQRTALERLQGQIGSVLSEVADERASQIAKGYTAEHDDEATEGELGGMAGLIALDDRDLMMGGGIADRAALYVVNKHPNRREQLIIAAALLVAEIERLDRGATRGGA